MFDDILERKKSFLDNKNNEFKRLENWNFSEGVSPLFW